MWTWLLEGADGARLAPEGLAVPTFPSQADAETWVGEMWRTLLGHGVEQVVLVEEDRTVYGPMTLRPGA